MGYRQVGLFRADSRTFGLSVEQVNQVIGELTWAGAVAEIRPDQQTGWTEFHWDTPATEHGWQQALLTPDIILFEGDREFVAVLVVAVRELFGSADDVWVGSPGLGEGRILRRGEPAEDVFEGWGDLPLDDFR